MKEPEREELKRLAAANEGVLLPGHVVEAARPDGAVLHGRFEWLDTKAAHLYRLEQAEKLIRTAVSVVDPVTGGPRGEPVRVRTWVNLSSERGPAGGYREIRAVMTNRDQREQLLQDARRELAAIRRKYRELEELSAIFAMLDSQAS